MISNKFYHRLSAIEINPVDVVIDPETSPYKLQIDSLDENDGVKSTDPNFNVKGFRITPKTGGSSAFVIPIKGKKKLKHTLK